MHKQRDRDLSQSGNELTEGAHRFARVVVSVRDGGGCVEKRRSL